MAAAAKSNLGDGEEKTPQFPPAPLPCGDEEEEEDAVEAPESGLAGAPMDAAASTPAAAAEKGDVDPPAAAANGDVAPSLLLQTP